MPEVDTKRVTDRRPLRFDSIDAALADIDAIVASERAGTLRRVGNWTPGQAFGHVATWIDYLYEGYPFQVPWLLRQLVKLRRNRYVQKGLPSGVRIPGVKGGTFGIEPLPTEQGAARLRASLERLRTEPGTHDSPMFGPWEHDEQIAINLRHAELHLSFFRP